MTIAKDATAVPQTSLLTLAYNQPAVVWGVQAISLHDPIARRLRELGFVPGEPVRIVAKGPVGADPLLIQIGFTRFALRRAEAARVLVEAAP